MQNWREDSTNLKGKIKAEAFRLGFNLCGFTTPDPPEMYKYFENWLDQGSNAGMAYLDSPRHRLIRKYPDQLFPGVKTIISLGWPYSLTNDKGDTTPNTAFIAGYTAGTDYHLFLPARLNELIAFLQHEINPNIKAQVYTDSAPILEREIASRAGLGWIGRNSCLISPENGSSFLLAELFTDLPLQPDPPFTLDRCGTCHRCMDACPTGCIHADRTIESNRCISYLTIENKESIPVELRPLIGQWLFGCDVCQTVCPWNNKDTKNLLQSNKLTWSVEEVQSILSMTAETFSDRYHESAIYRTKLKGLQRNALIWLGNNGSSKSQRIIEAFLQKTNDQILFETANWAINTLKNENASN
ncbi:tRNA epoxyqueuosine(34) reductase QueG [bacterium]|nr:tRNA epoxyqueuosine(34) reductase QueG [bacterium]